MINKILKTSGLTILFLCIAFAFVSASEYEDDLSPGLGTGIEGTLTTAPAESPAAGGYNVDKTVTLTAAGSSAICYTIDGTTPACNGAYACTTGTLYSSTISITSTKTVKSLSCYANETASSVATDTYTLTCATASVDNGTVAAYSGCAITCNSGYSLSGSTCVADSGGGGGGGSAATMSITTDGSVTATKSSGGKTTFTDPAGNDVQVKVSSNTVGSNTGFTIEAVDKKDDDVSGLFAAIGTIDGDFVGNYFYKFTAEDSDGNEVTEFDKNVKLTFYYDEDMLGTIDEEDLVIYYWDKDAEEWTPITNSKVYASSNKIVAYIDHFTYFGLFGAEGVAAVVDDDMTAEELAAKIEQLLGLIFALKAELAGLGGVSDIGDIPATFRFTSNLKQGMSSITIKYLQIVLNSNSQTRIAVSGVGSPGKETNYFGSLTKAAVIKFQEEYHTKILAPWGFTKGTGYVARTTMAKLNELLSE